MVDKRRIYLRENHYIYLNYWRHIESSVRLELASRFCRPRLPADLFFGWFSLTLSELRISAVFSNMATLDRSGTPPIGRYTLLPSAPSLESVSEERQDDLSPAQGT